MGMTLDNYLKETNTVLITQDAFVEMKDTMRKYQQLQADYEARLKADLEANLVELQLEIDEKFNDRPFSYNHHQRTEFYRDIDEVIQQKINLLKEKPQ